MSVSCYYRKTWEQDFSDLNLFFGLHFWHLTARKTGNGKEKKREFGMPRLRRNCGYYMKKPALEVWSDWKWRTFFIQFQHFQLVSSTPWAFLGLIIYFHCLYIIASKFRLACLLNTRCLSSSVVLWNYWARVLFS